MPAAFPIRRQIDWQLQSANKRLAVALAISLVLHGLIYAGWKAAPATIAFFKEAFERVTPAPRAAKQLEPEKPAPPREVPMVFVEIDPALATPEPPKENRAFKETKNYSSGNSIAANPVPKRGQVPKVDGTQTEVLTTLRTPPLQPIPPQPKAEEAKTPEKQVEVKPLEPKPKTAPPGDLALAKPTPKALELESKAETRKAEPAPPGKPRTLREARARNPAPALEPIKQEGGVERFAQVAMLDARGTVFGEYDSVFTSFVRTRWHQLIDENKLFVGRSGKVTLKFRIYQDGRISDPTILENTVGDMPSLLCLKAILDPAPFPPWPKEMRRQVALQTGAESREVRFTFFYH